MNFDEHSQLLLGPSSILPEQYTEAVLNQLKENKTSLLDFYAIFGKRALSLIKQRSEFAKNINLSFTQSDEKFFYYLNLYAFNLRSKQSLKQLLSCYFDIPCYKITDEPIFITCADSNIENQLGINTRLGNLHPTRSFQLACHIETINYIKYADLILNPLFFEDLFTLIKLYLTKGRFFKLVFELKLDKPTPAELKGFHLAWNAWLGSLDPNFVFKISLSLRN